jgi:hypothetical protein
MASAASATSIKAPTWPPMPAMHVILQAPSWLNCLAARSDISPTSDEPEQAYITFGAVQQPQLLFSITLVLLSV